MYHFLCNQCGNPRELLSPFCPFCGEPSSPNHQTKYKLINLKEGSPTVAEALTNLDQSIHDSMDIGLKVIVVIHGYGSSGKGGSIKTAVRQELQNNRWADCVRDFIFGESLHDPSSLHESANLSKTLEKKLIAEGVLKNYGNTLLLLYKKRLVKI